MWLPLSPIAARRCDHAARRRSICKPLTSAFSNLCTILEGLQGNWRLVGGEEGGKKEEIPFDKAAIMPIKGDRLKEVAYEGKKLEMLLELDSSQTPKAINLTYISPDGKSNGDSFLAIYALEGDTLRICFTPKEEG